MIHASRTAFQEQPNGDLVCTITITAADRAAVFAQYDDTPVPIYLAAAPVTLESLGRGVEALRERLKPMLAQAAESAMNTAQAISGQADDFVVQFDTEAETADKPPTQTIGASGTDTASVVEAVASGAHHWDHPAARHLDRMFKHEPFQVFALERLPKDPFAAPMEAATRLINKQIKGKPVDVGMAKLARVMDEYIAWTAKHELPTWPEKKA